MKKCTVKISTPISELEGGNITYTKEAVDKAIDEYMKKVSEDSVTFGWILDEDRSMANASYTIDAIHENDGEWNADITLLDTPMGKVVQRLLGTDEFEFVPNIAGFVEDGTVTDMFVKSIDISVKNN